MKQFKIRCSCLGHIMSEPKGYGITEKQLLTLQDLAVKKLEKGLTDKQEETLVGLVAKRDAPPMLSETAKTYLRDWFIAERFGRVQEFTNKFLEKGIAVEDEAIELYSRVSGRKFIKKNEEELENEYCTGTPDIIMDIVTDIKSSWNIFTFPMFSDHVESKLYYAQLQGYMYLTEKQGGALAYCLVDTPEELILKEINRTKWNASGTLNEKEEMTLYELAEKNMKFSDIEEKIRVKIFDIPRDHEFIAKIPQRVQMCRDYIKTLEKAIS